MQIRVLRNLGFGLPSYREGQVCEVDKETADDLCKRGLAELVKEAPVKAAAVAAEIKGVPPLAARSQVDIKAKPKARDEQPE